MDNATILALVAEYESLVQQWRRLQARPDLDEAARIGARFPDVLKKLTRAAEGWGIDSTGLHNLWAYGLAYANEDHFYGAYLAVERIKSKALAEPKSQADGLVTMKDVAGLVRLEPTSMRPYRTGWPAPDVPRRGRSPARWRYDRLLPVLRGQFPDEILPDRYAGTSAG